MSKDLRDQILLVLEEHAKTGSLDFKEDKEIAEQLGRSVSEIQRQLDILDSQGLIKSANSHQGNSARINPRGSLAVEQLEAPAKNKASSVISVFISHSHDDDELVKLLITLLRSALNLPSQQIRATSVDGFRLPGGSNTTEQLRIEVQEAAVLIGLISKSSLQSAFVIFELGARWGSGKPIIPLLAPDVEPELLAGPLKGLNALRYNSSAQLHQFVEEIAKHLGVELDRPAAYQKYIDEMVQLGASYEPVAQSSGINPATARARREGNPTDELDDNKLAIIRMLAQADQDREYYTTIASELDLNKVKTQHLLDELTEAGYLQILELTYGPGYGLSRKGRALAVKSGFAD